MTAADSEPVPQRRQAPRTKLTGRDGLLRRCFPVTLLDMSSGGVRIETRAALRPRGTYELTADLDDARLSLKVLVSRCVASGTVSDGQGGRALVYQAGASFLDLDASQRTALDHFLGRLQGVVEPVSCKLTAKARRLRARRRASRWRASRRPELLARS